jgi:hypothetical protein
MYVQQSTRRWGPAALALFALAVTSPSTIRAQSLDLVVSTSSDTQVGADPVRDEDILCRPAMGMPYVSIPSETSAALAGPSGSSTTHHVFGDVDALHDAGGSPAQDGLYISLVSNEAGFLDGDVLRGSASGFQVFLSEADFITACGATDGNVDVDAFHLEPNGRVLFSFAENEASAFLSGNTPGVIADGAVLTWMPSQGTADILYRESEIDALVSAALGSATTTGEVKAVSRDPNTGALLFTVQSPSAHDASIFSDESGGMLLAGMEESTWNFGSATEFDALSAAPRVWPALSVSAGKPAVGATETLMLRGGQPGAAYIVLLALSIGAPQIPTDGWGGLVLGTDFLFQASVLLAPQRTIVTDGIGEANLGFMVPPAAQAVDLFLQAVALASPHAATNPIVVEVGQ